MSRILISALIFALMMTVANIVSSMAPESLRSDISFVIGYLTLVICLLAEDKKHGS